MKILAFETATLAGSIALADEMDGLIAEVKIDIKIAHSERVVPSVKWLLDSARISVQDVDAFAVSIGPGSFTGLRIGLSTAKGFAYATGKPVVPVQTLDAFARDTAIQQAPYMSDDGCEKNEVYAALYKWENGGCMKIMPETAARPDELLERFHEPVIFTGDGAVTYRALILEKLGGNAIFAPLSRMSPSASAVAEIGLEKLMEGSVTDPVALSPFYIRKSEAEIKWKA